MKNPDAAFVFHAVKVNTDVCQSLLETIMTEFEFLAVLSL